MFHGDLFCAEKTMHRRLSDERQHFEALRLRQQARRLAHQAGTLQRGWMSRQGCWLLCRLGRLLVALGQRLEQYSVSQPLTLNGELSRGG
jgi:hypothetical protein